MAMSYKIDDYELEIVIYLGMPLAKSKYSTLF